MMFDALSKTLQKTRENIKHILKHKQEKIQKDLLEEILIESDIDFDIVQKITQHLPDLIKRSELEVAINRFFKGESYYDEVRLKQIDTKPHVDLIIGVNGAGKTTTIAKLANKYKKEGKSVLLGAGDTFRAAAIEQLDLWSKKIGVDIISSKIGHDPSSIAFDTINAGVNRNIDNIIIDTAGRLHNQVNLKNELLKISKVCSKALQNKPYRKLLVLDGTQGSSSISQAKSFGEIIDIDAIVITKLDGTSKGGSILTIIHELKLPIAYIGVGEKEEDLIEFNADEYIKALLDAIFKEDEKV